MNETIIINPSNDEFLHDCDPWEIYITPDTDQLYFTCFDSAYVVMGEAHTRLAIMALTKATPTSISYVITNGMESLNVYFEDGSFLIFTNSTLAPELEDYLESCDRDVTMISPFEVLESGYSLTQIQPHPSLKVVARVGLEKLEK